MLLIVCAKLLHVEKKQTDFFMTKKKKFWKDYAKKINFGGAKC